MKAVLLAGGAGTRISEESQYKPKPMIDIGGMPILWHIMKEYSYYGINEFIVCAGYKQNMIKTWFCGKEKYDSFQSREKDSIIRSFSLSTSQPASQIFIYIHSSKAIYSRE